MKKGRNNSWRKKIAAGVLLLASAGCFLFVFLSLKQKEDARISYDDLKEEVASQESGIPGKEEKKEQTPQREPSKAETYQSPIDFEKLWERNSDAYAWIRIEGTVIDYPILQKEGNDDYYLNRTIDNTEGLPGSIFTENASAKDFSDYNTVIYGHNMRDGTMFAALHNYADLNFMREHSQVQVYLPDKTLNYQIFAAVVYDDSNLLFTHDFSQKESRQSFLEEIASTREMQSVIDGDISVTAEDRLITLSTCIGNRPQNRWLVIAKQVT